MKHVFIQQIILGTCRLLFQARWKRPDSTGIGLCPLPLPAAVLPPWAFKGWKPEAQDGRAEIQRDLGLRGSHRATAAAWSAAPTDLLYKRRKWPNSVVSPRYVTLSVLIVLKYIVCVIFCYCCFSLFLYSSRLVWRFVFFVPVVIFMTLCTLTFTALNGVCYWLWIIIPLVYSAFPNSLLSLYNTALLDDVFSASLVILANTSANIAYLWVIICHTGVKEKKISLSPITSAHLSLSSFC